MLARPGGTFVDVYLTVVALEARHTEAAVVIDSIQADGTILAWAGGTFIHILLTMGPNMARLAFTGVPSSTLNTGTIVVARIAGAKRGLNLAAVFILALAAISIGNCDALKMRLWTRAGLTCISFRITAKTFEVWPTEAGEIQLARDSTANPVRWTSISTTCIIQEFTVPSHVGQRILRTEAPVASFCILTGTSILTWG